MNDFLDGVKQELQEVTNQIDIKTLSRVDEYFTKLEQDLKMQKKLLQDKIQKEMYKDLDIEYKIPKHELIDDSVPYIQFKKELYNATRKVDNFYFGKAEEDINGYFKWKSEIEIFQQELFKYNKFLFKINQNLPKEEFVIYIKFKCYPNWFFGKNGNGQYGITIDITYITNYGRFANIFENLHETGGKGAYGIKEKLFDILKTEEIKPLTYKMPAIFTKIIDAIYNENTSLMQECCSEYLTRDIENKKFKKENKIILETIKQPFEDMKSKYEKIINENIELEYENAKLKKEIELLKLQIEEQRKHFMG